MDVQKVGRAIRILRERAGYTQKYLADQLMVSDKAVSRWERGVGLPDISCLRRLSILLDTDTDSLLAGEAIRHGHEWCGVLFLRETLGLGERIWDKPLGDYLLSYFMLAGICRIAVACTAADRACLEERFGNGETLGLQLYYMEPEPKTAAAWAVKYERCMALTAPLFLYGVDLTSFLLRAMSRREGSICLCVPLGEGTAFPRLRLDEENRVITADGGNEKRSRYEYYGLPLRFFPGTEAEAQLGGSDATQRAEPLNRGFVALELRDKAQRENAARFVELVQAATGLPVCELREIAGHRGLV